MSQMEEKRKRSSIISNIILLVSLLVFTGTMGEHGAGYLAGVFELFFLLLILTVYSLPEAESRLLRTRMQKGQSRNVKQVLRAVFCMGLFYSVLGSLLLFFGAEFFLQHMVKSVYGVFCLRLLIPGYVLFVFAQVFRGYFQGMGSIVPTGISKILGNVIWFAAGIIFCFLFKKYGDKVSALLINEEFSASFSGAGMAAGFDVAMLFVLLFLVFVYQTNKRSFRTGSKETLRVSEQIRELVYSMVVTMLPMLLYGFLGRVTVLGGMAVYQHGADVSVEYGIGVCGAFYGKYLAVLLVFSLLLYLPILSLEGTILNAYRKEEYKYVREKISFGVHFLLIYGTFLTVLFAVLGNTLMQALFSNDSGQAGTMFTTGSSLVVLIPLAVFLGSVLNGIGKEKMVLLVWLAGAVIFFGCGIVSVNLLHAGMTGIVVSLCLSWLFMVCACGFFCIRFLKWRPEWIYRLVLPTGTAALTGIILMLLNKALVTLVGKGVSFLICLVFGMLGDFVLLLSLRGIRREELELYPAGRLLVRFAETIRLL